MPQPAVSIAFGTTEIALDPDLQWSDEFSWSPVKQSAEYSITGALLIDESVMLAGRPITLAPPDPSAAWLTRATLNALMAWAEVPGRVMTLTLRGAARSVMFRRTDGPAIEAEPVIFVADPEPGGFGDHYLATLRFIEV